MKITLRIRYFLPFLSLFLFLANSSFAQLTTLVGYNFNNQDLSHYILDGSVIQTPPTELTFSNLGTIPIYQLNGTGNYRLQTDTSNDYLELRINTIGQTNMTVKFDANLAPIGSPIFSFSFTGKWIVQSDNGTNGANWVQIGETANMSAGAFLGFIFEGNTSASIPIPAASENLNEVRFRLRPAINGFGNFAIRIDNLRVERGVPNISVFANDNDNTPLPHDAPYSIATNTDFGTAVSVGNIKDSRFFRIRNIVPNTTGAPLLKVSGITVEGTNASDFEILVAQNYFPTTVQPATSLTPDTYRQFKIRFAPTGDGIRTAQIHIHSDGNQNPYILNVIGQGASCSLETTPYVVNEINPGVAEPTLPSNINPAWIISGTAQNNNRSITLNPGGVISLPTYNPGPGDNQSAWFARGTATPVVKFGGDEGINVSGQKDVSIAFNVGAYSTGNVNNAGPNSSSFIILEVDHGGVSKEVLRLSGYNSIGSNTNKYPISNPLSGANYFETTYGTSAQPISITNSNSNKYQTIRVNIPQSKILEDPNLKFRIKMSTPSNSRVWIIDNVRIDVSNSEFTERIGTDWTNGSPNANKKMIIPNGMSYQIPNAGLEVCECEVKESGTLRLGSPTVPTYLKVKGKITVREGGIFDVRTNSNLVQVEDDAVNVGKIKVERQVAGIHNVLPNAMDYIYWSSPVSGQQLKAFSPGTPNNRFYRYEESDDYFYPEDHLSDFKFGKGYAIRAEGGLPNPYTKKYEFKGTPNNGNQYDANSLKFIKSPDGNGYNLIGNPYPSNIDGDTFLLANSASIYSSVYFWENNIYIPNQQGAGYYGSNYAIYNGTGGNPGSADDGSWVVPDGTIKSGQGFIVQVKPEGNDESIRFNNSMRLTSNSGVFYSKLEKDRFWLTLTNSNGIIQTMLIGFIPGATDDFENDFDSPLFSVGSDAIYSILGDEKLGIQGLEYPMNINEVIPIGVKHFTYGKYKIALAQKEGILKERIVLLKDKYLDLIHNLSVKPYEYEGEEGEFTDRFEILFKYKESISIAENVVKNHIEFTKQDHQIVISSTIDKLVSVEMFNLAGFSIFQATDINQNEYKIPLSSFSKQIVVVKVITDTGKVVNQKFILN